MLSGSELNVLPLGKRTMSHFLLPLVSAVLLLLGGLASAPAAIADDNAKQPATAAGQAVDSTVADLAKAVRDAVVIIRFAGRDGGEQGLGTGFVIEPDGLIATNLHV